jgi:cellulose biosynthesis protein BcsQ
MYYILLVKYAKRNIKMNSIAIFNNKGGVGKTTLLCNIAAFLSIRKGKKVLVIDADPQCNATQNMFSEEEVTHIYSSNIFTLYNVIGPLSRGKGFSDDIQTRKSPNFHVDVIPGDPRLALTEDLLAQDWGTAIGGNTRGLRTTFLFSDLLSKCGKYDYVIFDMGPSLGSINRAVLIATHYFITPMSTDIFSLRAIENISYSLIAWKKALQNGLRLNDEKDEIGVQKLGWHLQYAGYVTQQYTSKRNAEGNRRPVKAFDKIMQKIPDLIAKELVKKLQDKKGGLDYALGSIPTLHSLIPLSQSSRKPIFNLKAEDGVVGSHFSKVKEYEIILRGIVDKLLVNLSRIS